MPLSLCAVVQVRSEIDHRVSDRSVAYPNLRNRKPFELFHRDREHSRCDVRWDGQDVVRWIVRGFSRSHSMLLTWYTRSLPRFGLQDRISGSPACLAAKGCLTTLRSTTSRDEAAALVTGRGTSDSPNDLKQAVPDCCPRTSSVGNTKLRWLVFGHRKDRVATSSFHPPIDEGYENFRYLKVAAQLCHAGSQQLLHRQVHRVGSSWRILSEGDCPPTIDACLSNGFWYSIDVDQVPLLCDPSSQEPPPMSFQRRKVLGDRPAGLRAQGCMLAQVLRSSNDGPSKSSIAVVRGAWFPSNLSYGAVLTLHSFELLMLSPAGRPLVVVQTQVSVSAYERADCLTLAAVDAEKVAKNVPGCNRLAAPVDQHTLQVLNRRCVRMSGCIEIHRTISKMNALLPLSELGSNWGAGCPSYDNGGSDIDAHASLQYLLSCWHVTISHE